MYSAFGPFTIKKERMQKSRKFKIYLSTKKKKKIDKACFHLDIGYADFKVLHDKALIVAKNPKYNGYQWGIASMAYNCFDKKSSGGVVTNTSN